MSIQEREIRDFLADRIADLPGLIVNLEQIKGELAKVETDFLAILTDDGGPSPYDLLKLILARRNHQGIEALYGLELVDKEIPLLSTGKGGFQPRADLLACNMELGVLFLIEVKRLVGTERQAVTELAAYSSGLQYRFWGLSPLDHLWVPISTEWRTTLKAALANEVIWGHRAVLPLSCRVVSKSGKVGNLELKVVDIVRELDEALALSQFAWHCFDSLELCLPTTVADPRTFVEFICATASRLGFSGFVLYGTALGAEMLPYPHSFVVGVHNPMLGALKRRQLEIVREHDGPVAMRKEVKKPLWPTHDIDFPTMEDFWPKPMLPISMGVDSAGEPEQTVEFVSDGGSRFSIRELASAAGNRIGVLWKEIKTRLDLMRIEYELGDPSIHALLTSGGIGTPLLKNVGFFGLIQEALYERLRYEYAHVSDDGDGPIMGDMGGDPLMRAAAWDTFVQFMELMNFEHDCQVGYSEDDGDTEE